MLKGFGARTYRKWGQTDDLKSFRVTVQETDLLVLALADLSAIARQKVVYYRTQIEQYIEQYPEFQATLHPIEMDEHAPAIIQAMIAAAKQVGVGPFAAVAGAIAEFVGNDLLAFSSEIIVENGGDIFAASARSRIFGIYAGDSAFTAKIALKLDASQLPCGVCTSSGTVGHSLSFGKADAAIVVSRSTALADACATAIGNMIGSASDIDKGLKFAEQTTGIDGVVVILGNNIGIWGAIELIKTGPLPASGGHSDPFH